jgi:glycosyltransferase involved in cell wall biosynthesis
VTRAGGTGWIVSDQHNGLLVNCGDHEAMARAAFRLLEEPGLAERLALTARRDLNRYSWANIGWKWIDLYSNLAPVRNRQLTPAAEASEYECSNR